MQDWDVIVLGAGAAGLMAAIEAARRGRRVVVIDHARAAGEKIRISGGGRCNFTNLGVAADRFLSKNPRFALSALKRFTPWDMVGRITGAGIAWHEKEEGQLFCDGSSRQVVDWLLRELFGVGGKLWLETTLGPLRRGAAWEVETSRGSQRAASVIVATGGKSIPKMGATGHGLKLAEDMGLPLVETRPGLVPLTFALQELDWIAPLAGVSVPARVVPEQGRSFENAVLFTHRGLSGPAILQVSNYWREGQPIHLSLVPGLDLAAWLRAAKLANGRQAVRSLLADLVPDRLARHLAAPMGEGPISAVSGAALDGLARRMQDWVLTPVGSEGYRTAEVMLGGVDTAALDGRTMEVKGLPGLYFVGEVVDVTGWLGGYNFHWAWASGWAAGQVA